ncbi:MAG: DUF4038 domain-containing protein [Planctomycetes bacterium]|jgi:hypothetical protein|nr:DUF4038 domain-containing protein [Planctomycetota bacterium]
MHIGSMACAAPVHTWETVEITLHAAGAAADAYAGAQVWVDLKGPGFVQRCPAFWDGGNTFRVRVMATAPGTWTWRSGTSWNDPGLSGRSGTFEATPWTAAELQANPNRRGLLRIAAGKRHFEYADGTPCFVLADTLWAGNTARCGLGTNEDGPFFQYLADRQAKGFNTILMQYIHGYGDYPDGQAHCNEGGYAFLERDPARLNPAYFQALDRRMQALWERGFIAAVPTMWWGKTKRCLFTPQQAQQISVYVAARYGTFNSLWSLSGEYQYTFGDCGWTPGDFSALGAAVQRHNPWRHPLSIHPSARLDWKAPHDCQSSLPFHGESWLDHHWLQTGQSVDRLYNIVTRLAENRALTPAVPVFCSEACYERADAADCAYHTRWQVWTALLNGAAGYGHGAQGLWQFFDPADPQGEPGKRTTEVVPWRDALRLPGSGQVRAVRTFLASLDWWKLQPRREALRVDGRPNRLPTKADLTPPHAAGSGDAIRVIYVPRGNQTRTIALSGITKPATARWFDPRHGEFAGPAVAWDPEIGTLPPRPAPADEDWVLLIERPSGSREERE